MNESATQRRWNQFRFGIWMGLMGSAALLFIFSNAWWPFVLLLLAMGAMLFDLLFGPGPAPQLPYQMMPYPEPLSTLPFDPTQAYIQEQEVPHDAD